MEAFDATIVILTANRLSQLQRLIGALQRQPVSAREILVVDNGSTDGTGAWLRDAAPETVRRIEGRTDASFAEARNLAVGEARGEWVLFIDDDCVPAPGWIARARELASRSLSPRGTSSNLPAPQSLSARGTCLSGRARDLALGSGEGRSLSPRGTSSNLPAPQSLSARGTYPRGTYDAFGGPVVAMKPLPNPEWFDPEMGWAIGLSTPGVFSEEAGRSILPQTANLAVRRQVSIENPFQSADAATFADEELTKYASGREDAELWERLRSRGYRTGFDGAFVVLHDIDPARVDREYIRERMLQDARAAVRRASPPRPLARALNELVSGFLPDRGRQALRLRSGRALRRRSGQAVDRLWRMRQWEYLRACRRAGEKPLAGVGLAGKLLKAWFSQAVARLKRGARETFVRRRATPVPPLDSMRRIAVAVQGFVGDLVILAPVLCWLREALPKSIELVLISGPRALELYGELKAADRVVIANPGQLGEIGAFLRKERPDALFVPYWHDTPAGVLFKGAAPVVTFNCDVGFPRQWWHDRADVIVGKDFEVNELVNLARLFAPLGLEGPPRSIEWPRDADAIEKVDRMFAECGIVEGDVLVGAHADATHPEKIWPLDRWSELIERLIARFPNMRVVLVGADRSVWRDQPVLERHSQRIVNLCGRTNLRVLAEVLRRMRLSVSTDSGPRHLAAAVGCPTIALYGWTDPRRWGAFFDPGKHTALCIGDPLMTQEELEARPGAAIRRIPVDYLFKAISGRLAALSLPGR